VATPQGLAAVSGIRAELPDQSLAQRLVRGDQVLAALVQPGHPIRSRRAVAFLGIAAVAGQDEIPDLVEVAIVPYARHEDERQHVIDGHPARPGVGERGAAVGAATVLLAA
jgi:hypothetical protein